MSIHKQAVGSAGIRDWLNQNSAVVTVAAVAILVIALAVVIRQGSGNTRTPPDSAWYFVPETGATVVDKANLIPPIMVEGKQAVKAHYYGCDDCEGENKFLGYYEKYSDQAKTELEKINATQAAGGEVDSDAEMRAYELAMTGRFYSKDGKAWVPAESPQGHAMQETLRDNCGTRKLTYCSP